MELQIDAARPKYLNSIVQVIIACFLRLDSLVEELQERNILSHPLLEPYIHPVHIHYDQTNEDGLLSVSETLDYITRSSLPDKIKAAVPKRVANFSHLFSRQDGALGLHRTSFCMISTENSVVVDPIGDVYKCYDEAGRPEHRVGEITNGFLHYFEDKLARSLSRNVATIPQCRTCSMALVCGGECGAFSKAKYGDYFTPYCQGTKEMLLNAVRREYLKYSSGTIGN
jgi:uncharacterized protein